MKQDDVVKRIEKALTVLLHKDRNLFTIDVHERSISHKLAEYLQQEFINWDVDCEYNRCGSDPKKDEKTYIYPDIIVHQRRTKENLLAIELKKKYQNTRRDFEKLSTYLSDPRYNYDFVFFICFKRSQKQYKYLIMNDNKELICEGPLP